MPQAMSLEHSRRKVGVGGGLSPGLQRKNDYMVTRDHWMQPIAM